MLYRHKDILETIFRIFDKDSSGFISMTEFQEACEILKRHAGVPMTSCYIADIAHSLDLNKDGFIDFNEFLEAFRIVNTGVADGILNCSGRALGVVEEEGEQGDGGGKGEQVLEIEDLELNDGEGNGKDEGCCGDGSGGGDRNDCS